MKILMLGWELPPHNSGGLGVACYQLCKSLADRKVDIEFVLPYTASHTADFMRITAAYPVDVIEVQRSGTAYDSYRYLTSTGELKEVDLFTQIHNYEQDAFRLAEAAEFDIIHAHDWLTFKAAIKLKRATDKPVILHVHSIEADRAGGKGRGNPLVREIEELSMLEADRIIAVSQHTKQMIAEEYKIPEDRIEVVHNSIDTDALTHIDDRNIYNYLVTMKQLGYKVVTNIGRLTIQKGLTNLLRAAALVVQKNPKTLFLIVGDGEQQQELLLLAAELGISQNVIFTGFQRGKAWRDAYRIGDLFVMPSVSEPFGLTPLEAVAYGTPTLISKQSGVSEILQNSLKVDFWDINEMANQIVMATQNQSLNDELKHQAYTEYKKLSWSESADKLIGIYSQHLGLAS